MIKLQQYYIFKISTNRLRRSNYSIPSLTLQDARKSGEIISIGDSQMLRSLRKIKHITVDPEEIESLMLEKKKIKSKKASKENSLKLLELEKRLDYILFVPEIISVSVDDLRQYEHIGKSGFWVNHVKYVRLLCGAGQARRNTALFIDEHYEKKLKEILNNNRDINLEIAPAKFNAYFSLASSSSLPIKESTPLYFCVVPDLEIKRIERVDYIEEKEEKDKDDVVWENVEKEIPFNLWDGQGLISPRLAETWAIDELGLDYIPSTFIIRANFIKGMLAVFDFHKFSEEVAQKHFITDVWGNQVNIRDMDIILTQSQFKLWNAYSSQSEYVQSCQKNGLGWSISKVSPKIENNHCFLNYQFIQVLDLDDSQIERLCNKTVDYFKDTINQDIRYALLYLLGKKADYFDANIFSNLHDNVTRALILNNKLLKDSYIQDYLIHSLNKRIRESYMGNLIINGQYTTMVADPYAFMEYLFGLPIKGLLNRGEHYNYYWLSRNKKRIAAMRAPLTWKSEVNILNLKNNSAEIENWYSYLNCCVVYNIFGNDNMIHGGSDMDGDLVCLTDTQEIIDGAMKEGLPIYYESKKSPKEKIVESELYKYDIKGFNSKVGFVTNCATSAFAMLPGFSTSSLEYKELINRLKRFRKEQGSTIDAAKGLDIKPFPIHWTKWNSEKKLGENPTPESLSENSFKNRIAIDKRPIFMKWVYPSYNKKYSDYTLRYSLDSRMRYDKDITFLLSQYFENRESLSEAEIKSIEDYYRFNPFIETPCLMNKISRYTEGKIKQFKHIINNIEEKERVELISLLKDREIRTDKEKLKLLYDLYRKYKSEKRNFGKMSNILNYSSNEDNNNNISLKFKTIEQYNKYIRQEAYLISSNGSELANLAVDICYLIHPKDNKSFAWQVFGNEIIENIYRNNRQETILVPCLINNGDTTIINSFFTYLGEEKYEMREIDAFSSSSSPSILVDNSINIF